MSVAIVNSSTITEFVNDTAKFDSFVKEWFGMIDENRDGKLSGEEIRRGFVMFLPSGSESQAQQEIFKKLGEDLNGALDLKKFKSLMTEIMNAFAEAIGATPIVVALGKNSLLMKAVQH
ncbi:hypothetical protein VNO77_13528 [Canavalia gladiata]|uniref:EF-hand domain-containing protein n=1 Tax=Canavalia gladiata TaxID=3824 RepID=A0AAN9LXX2_CANGL